jgi:hypothetical protein
MLAALAGGATGCEVLAEHVRSYFSYRQVEFVDGSLESNAQLSITGLDSSSLEAQTSREQRPNPGFVQLSRDAFPFLQAPWSRSVSAAPLYSVMSLVTLAKPISVPSEPWRASNDHVSPRTCSRPFGPASLDRQTDHRIGLVQCPPWLAGSDVFRSVED